MIRGIQYDATAPFVGVAVEIAEAEQVRFDGVRFTGMRSRQVQFSDAAFTACDLAQVRADDTSLIRATVISSRLLGSSWSDCTFRHVAFDACRADLSHWRRSKLRNVVFTDCGLNQADFQWAELTDVLFQHCELNAAVFEHATATRVRFEDCTLADIGGGTSLAGATVQGPGGMELALALARDAGIRIEH